MASDPQTAKHSARDRRRAAALRANIKRRKAQARSRAEAENKPAAAAHDSAGIVRDSHNNGPSSRA
jgi:hypothetical protein